MRHRIALWGCAGVFVALCWALYSAAVRVTPAEPIPWMLARLSCPIVFVGFYFHVGLQLYWVLLANAATYALAGAVVEALRRPVNRAK